MQCCLTPALRCRLNSTLALVQALLKSMGERNPLLLICPWEGIVSAWNHETASWCTCVFLGGLPCKHGLAQNYGVWDQSPGQNSSGAEQNQPQCSGVSCGKPHHPPETMAVRKTTAEERTHVMLGWMQLCCSWGKGCTSVFMTLRLQNQQFAVVPKIQPSRFSQFPLYRVKQYLWNCERGGFLVFLGFF